MSKIYISKSAEEPLKEYLKSRGHILCQIEGHSNIDPLIACHPDVYMCKLGNMIFHGDPAVLTRDYPGNSIYNGCSTGKFFIHNLKITSPKLLEAVDSLGQIKVHTAQGYAKCSCVTVDEDSIITADRGIEKAAKKAGMDVLLVEPAQVLLPGYKYGFLGGASGRAANEIIFNGDISAHSDYKRIKEFIENRNLKMIYFPQYPLTDIGSVIEDAKQ